MAGAAHPAVESSRARWRPPRHAPARAAAPMNAFARPSLRLPWHDRLPRRPRESSVTGAVLKFALAALLGVMLVGAGGVVELRRASHDEALHDAKDFVRLAGRGIVAPHITPAVLKGDPAALARVDRAVRQRILGDDVVRVKIWAADGRIVYSDASSLIGSRYRLGAEELGALRTKGVFADAGELSRPENRFERRYGNLVEVYLSIRATDGTPLLFETYERASALMNSSAHRWLSLAPALIGALLVLELALIPLAWSLARRLRDRQREREVLLHRAIASSELERRRIAADLHDGPLQRLASLSFDLSLEAELHGEDAAASGALRAGAGQTRETIRELRSLLVDIYPPTLSDEGLKAAVGDLAAALVAEGTAVDVDIPEALDVAYDVEALFFRVAQEALRNARAHAEAAHVEVAVHRNGGDATLVVADDGRGFDPAPDGPAGHFGLRLMEDLSRDAGGDLHIDSAPGQGTRVTLEVPAR
jgi:two-component system, NarL family, sensor kinase